MLPGLGGIELCRTLRAESAVPIIMLTARSTEHDPAHLRARPHDEHRPVGARRARSGARDRLHAARQGPRARRARPEHRPAPRPPVVRRRSVCHRRRSAPVLGRGARGQAAVGEVDELGGQRIVRRRRPHTGARSGRRRTGRQRLDRDPRGVDRDRAGEPRSALRDGRHPRGDADHPRTAGGRSAERAGDPAARTLGAGTHRARRRGRRADRDVRSPAHGRSQGQRQGPVPVRRRHRIEWDAAHHQGTPGCPRARAARHGAGRRSERKERRQPPDRARELRGDRRCAISRRGRDRRGISWVATSCRV
jgi:hypothetical protein